MDQTKFLFNHAIKLLGRRRYSIAELTGKLTKKLNTTSTGSPQDINQVIKRLKELKYLNDEEFAALYIRDQISRKPQGIRLLKTGLAKKGLASEIIRDALRAAAIDEIELARIAVLKKSKSLGVYPKKKRDEKLMRFLQSRGFSGATIMKLIHDA